MLQRTHSLDDFDKLGQDNSGIFHSSFLMNEQLETIGNEVERAFNTAEENRVDGMVGVAYERYSDLYVCSNGNVAVPQVRQIIEDKIFSRESFSPYSNRWCASLVKFGPLDGMTSHRDYSYNRLMLGALVLKGNVLFGSSMYDRGDSYEPSNLVLAQEGDLVALKAPNQNSQSRPFFSVFSPKESMIMRLWMRDTSRCTSCSGERNG